MALVSVSDELVYTLLVVERRKENTDRLDIEHWHESWPVGDKILVTTGRVGNLP